MSAMGDEVSSLSTFFYKWGYPNVKIPTLSGSVKSHPVWPKKKTSARRVGVGWVVLIARACGLDFLTCCPRVFHILALSVHERAPSAHASNATLFIVLRRGDGM